MQSAWNWRTRGELNHQEWEALCDGCGQCCLKRWVKNDEVTVFSVACELLDIDTARCLDYANRLKKVPSCHDLTPETVPEYAAWLPQTCAYRRLHKGKSLPSWHPLLTGDRSRMRKKGIKVSTYAVPSGSVSRRQKARYVIARFPLSQLQTTKPKARRSARARNNA